MATSNFAHHCSIVQIVRRSFHSSHKYKQQNYDILSQSHWPVTMCSIYWNTVTDLLLACHTRDGESNYIFPWGAYSIILFPRNWITHGTGILRFWGTLLTVSCKYANNQFYLQSVSEGGKNTFTTQNFRHQLLPPASPGCCLGWCWSHPLPSPPSRWGSYDFLAILIYNSFWLKQPVKQHNKIRSTTIFDSLWYNYWKGKCRLYLSLKILFEHLK